MLASTGIECPYCHSRNTASRTFEDELETAFILIPRLDAIRFNLIQVQALLARIESQATIYQLGIRRLCGEADYLLSVNLGAVRSTIEQARHHRPLPPSDSPPAWW